MTTMMVAHANVHHMPCGTLLVPDFRGGSIYPFRRLCCYGARNMQHNRRLGMPIKHTNKCRQTMLIFPIVSFAIESQTQHLAEYGQSIMNFFQNEAAAAAKIFPVSDSPQSQSESTVEDLLHNLSMVPIEVSIAAVAVVASSALGYLVAALPTSKREGILKENSGDTESPAGEWLLVMNSTPFNRFVMMRCPSIMFEDVDVYESLSKKLTVEGHHVVRVRNNNVSKSDDNGDTNVYSVRNDLGNDGEWSGRVLQIASKSYNSFVGQVGKRPKEGESTPIFQRTFLYTEDGGVLAIDWPSHLELSGEHGLDTTFLLVPGSTDGSGDKRIQEFVQRSIRCGYFPIVLNPRGCGGSPLTTPRLFTAGDSDDVRMAVDFVLKSRPWATIMAVGWGYGANMLVKYLGEEEAATPVTAAVCIENIFDMEEPSKLKQEDRDNCFDQKLTSEFVQILKSNQMVFEGKRKDFDVKKGFLAKSVRKFDEAISMVSKGYNDIQEFYKDSSSKTWINNVQIPILCIQDNSIIGKTYSIPRHVFEDSPFATLIFLLTRREKLSIQTTATGHSDSLVIEWLAAVELAFLKGRHPMLQGIDVTFKLPMKGRSFGQQSQRSQNGGELMARKTNSSTGINSSVYLPRVYKKTRGVNLWDGDHSIEQGAAHTDSKALVDTTEYRYGSDEEFRSERIDKRDKESHGSSDEDATDDDESEGEQGQVWQAAESVMKVLDVTMPGTLSERQKEEVLEAVGRGETIVAALQEACPGDVREKMATAVSAAVKARGISMKLAGFGKKMPAPKIPDGMVEKIQESLGSIVHNKVPGVFAHDAAKSPLSDTATNNGNVVVGNGDQGNLSRQHESDKNSVQEGFDTKQPESNTSVSPVAQAQNGNGAVMESPDKVGSEEQGITQGEAHENEIEDTSEMNASEQEKGERGAKPASDDTSMNQGDSKPAERQGESAPPDEQKPNKQDQKQEILGTASQTNEPPQTEKKNESSTVSITSSEDNNKKGLEPNVAEVSSPQIPSQVPSASPLSSIDMGRAFEAFTGVDDSTQMAVTSVFGVIENVLEQLEKEQGQKEEMLEQPLLPEDEINPTKGSRNEIPLGINSQKQDSCQEEPSGVNLGQLDASESTARQQISEESSDQSNRTLGETSVQTDTIKEIGLDFDTKRSKTAHNCSASLSSASTGLEKDVTFDRALQVDDANLALEYFEDENVWKLIDDTLDTGIPSNTQGKTRAQELDEDSKIRKSSVDMLTSMETTQVIDPECMTVDDEMKLHEIYSSFPVSNLCAYDDYDLASESSGSKGKPWRHDGMGSTSHHLQMKVGDLVIDSLQLELCRRLGNSEMSLLGATLEQDVAKIGSAVAKTVESGMQLNWPDFVDKRVSEKMSNGTPLQETGKAGKLHVETIISALNEVYGNMVILPSLLPPGVVFGVVLTALSPLDILSTDDAQDSKELVQIQRGDNLALVQSSSNYKKPGSVHKDNSMGWGTCEIPSPVEQPHDFSVNGMRNKVDDGKEEVDRGFSSKDMKLSGGVDARESNSVSADQTASINNNMMGAVAAAMGATAAFASQRPSNDNLSDSSKHKSQTTGGARFAIERDDDQADNDDSKSSIVSTLAEKARSVAAPVVPTKEDGGVDHERLVEIMAGLGQKGGILRFFGKVALLWGGLRGAMSLTGRLLDFFHISDRPLYQRLLGFIVMALLLWSPVLVPLLPTLLQQWALQSHTGVASTAALIGLYGAVVILITIWGRKIRGYEDPLHQYGVNIQLGLNARQLQSLMSGFTMGLSLVASVYLLGVSLHLIQVDWAPALSFNSSKAFLSNLVSGWRILISMVQCFGISLAVSFVEELFFRSWLQEEISADLGFHRATAISGLAFSISHWSLPVMPALWLLSLILTGAKVSCNGDLSLAIGIHAGLIAGIRLINLGGQVKYGANAAKWLFGHQTGDPFTGLIGVSILGMLALLFYPWFYKGKNRQ